MRVEVEFTIHCRNSRVAEAAYKAVQPDNVKLPEGLTLSMSPDGRCLNVILTSDSKLETLISTVDELLEDIQVALDVLQKAE